MFVQTLCMISKLFIANIHFCNKLGPHLEVLHFRIQSANGWS